jgi:hypothetical protein
MANEMIETSEPALIRDEPSKPKHRKSVGVNAWSVAGGAALVLLAAAVLVNFHDIKRYLKISTM